MIIYYLLYKFKNSKIYWIVKTYDNRKEIEYDFYHSIVNENEEYLIVKRKIKDKKTALLELERKQFRFKVFLFKKSDLMIKLNKINKSDFFYKLKKSAKVFCL